MSAIRLRPRFRDIIPIAQDEVIRRMSKQIKDPQSSCQGAIIDHHIILKIPLSEQNYWSPQLSLELEKVENGTLVRGLFGPKPAVWTMFMFFYSAVGFFTLMGLMYGLSQWMINQAPWALWSLPAGLLLLLVIHLIARTGKGLGKDQMIQLHNFYRETLTLESDV